MTTESYSSEFEFGFVVLVTEFDSNFKLLQKQEFDIPEHMMNHDWAFTETHYVLFGNRIKLDVPGTYYPPLITPQHIILKNHLFTVFI